MIKKVLVVVVIVALAIWIRDYRNYKMTNLKIGNTQVKIEIADTLPKQVQGLSGRDSLCADCGMLFVYDRPKIQNFWMKGMQFPLDMIFIRGGVISEIAENIPVSLSDNPEDPVRVQSSFDADQVLEVNAGFASEHHLRIGDSASLDR